MPQAGLPGGIYSPQVEFSCGGRTEAYNLAAEFYVYIVELGFDEFNMVS